ncbi:MAG TPA: PP2C family serine/threonine-protein phosphatase [Streptosporangiaceae bacterium]
MSAVSGRDGRRGPWRVHGLSVEGYRHLRGGVPCQDAWHFAVTGPARDPVTVLAVADGAGSRPCSDKGAELAARLATTHFGRRATPAFPGADAVHDQLRAAFHDVREAFLRQTGDDADDYATTLTVVVLASTWVGHLSVGDGFVVLRAGVEDGQPQFHLLPQADAPSEYSNETVFITTANAESWLRTACVRDYAIDGVLLSTDGLAQIALSWRDGRPDRPNESFAAAVFRSIDNPGHDPAGDDAALAELLRSDRFTAINADDKTLLRAVRR